VGPRAGLDTEVRGKVLLPLPEMEHRSPGRPVRSQTLYPAPFSVLLGVINVDAADVRHKDEVYLSCIRVHKSHLSTNFKWIEGF
jgi:hypothetical protein